MLGVAALGWNTGVINAADAPVAVSATAPVFPALLGKQDNRLLRINIRNSRTEPITLTGLTISLAGTTPSDIAALRVLAIPAAPNAVAEPITALAVPKATALLPCEWKLRPGDNDFWLTTDLSPSASLSRRVAASVESIATSVGTVLPKPSRPLSRRIGFAVRTAGQDNVHTSRIPVLATSAKGTLLCAFDLRRRSSRDLQQDIDVGLRRSEDGGQSWGPTQVIMDMGAHGGLPEEQNGCGDPGLLIDRQTGEIFCFALWMHGKPGKHQWRGDGSEAGYEIGKTAQFMVTRSRDDGRTWSKPVNLTRELKKESWILFAPSPQQGIQLEDGVLVMPAQGRDERGVAFATVMVSRDHGETWAVGGPTFPKGNECQAATLSDGSIMLNIRNNAGQYRGVSVTKDVGRTWIDHPTSGKTLLEPRCNGSLYRWDSPDQRGAGWLLFANPHDPTIRRRFTIQVSVDDGMTWPADRHLLLDEERGFGYASLSRVDDDHIGVVYEGSQAHIVFERVSRAELTPK